MRDDEDQAAEEQRLQAAEQQRLQAAEEQRLLAAEVQRLRLAKPTWPLRNGALTTYADEGHMPAVKSLLEQGGNVNERDNVSHGA